MKFIQYTFFIAFLIVSNYTYSQIIISTPTQTPTPTNTFTLTPTRTPRPTFTNTPTVTSTPTITPTFTPSPTRTPIPTVHGGVKQIYKLDRSYFQPEIISFIEDDTKILGLTTEQSEENYRKSNLIGHKIDYISGATESFFIDEFDSQDVYISPDKKTLMVKKNYEIKLIDIRSGNVLHVIHPDENVLLFKNVGFSPNSQSIYFYSSYYELFKWNFRTGKMEKRLTLDEVFIFGHMIIFPDESKIITTDITRVRINDLNTGESIMHASLSGGSNSITDLTLSRDGSKFIARFFFQRRSNLYDSVTGNLLHEFGSAARFVHHGEWILNETFLLDPDTFELIANIKGGLDFSMDGNLTLNWIGEVYDISPLALTAVAAWRLH